MSTPTLCALLLLATLLVLAWRSWRRQLHLRWRFATARAAESEADHLLVRQGYRIVGAQVTGYLPMEIDGARHDLTCRADRIVERRGQLFLVEVKTGDFAPDPTLPATRRQLLEYLVAFDVDGILLVDMSARTICTVAFPSIEAS